LESFNGFRMRRKRMDNQGTGTAPCGQEAASEPRERVFILGEHEPLPDGLKEGDEGVFVIRLVAATREKVEAARAAY
jgi:hypothetical protein